MKSFLLFVSCYSLGMAFAFNVRTALLCAGCIFLGRAVREFQD